LRKCPFETLWVPNDEDFVSDRKTIAISNLERRSYNVFELEQSEISSFVERHNRLDVIFDFVSDPPRIRTSRALNDVGVCCDGVRCDKETASQTYWLPAMIFHYKENNGRK